MPKKWHSRQYSKPPSTVPASFSSSRPANHDSGSSNASAQSQSVNQLLSSLRNTGLSPGQRSDAAVPAPSLPPPIRQLLNIRDTPPPRPRSTNVRRLLANGQRLPPGPAPPSSWLGLSVRGARSKDSIPSVRQLRSRPQRVDYFPGLETPEDGSLVDICLKQLAQDWLFHVEYDQYYIAALPTRLRELLLSYLVVYGPDPGLTYDGLRTLLELPGGGHSTENNSNEELHRLDLAGAVGNTVSFKQLQVLVTASEDVSRGVESWEETSIPTSLQAPVPSLTHLSLSHPPSGISWSKLLKFSSFVPTLTHLSLAHWPVPNLTPNALNTKVSSLYSPDVQFGGTNYYSHSIDDDWTEASSVLRRLSMNLYSLRYLDLDGCTSWARALSFHTFDTPGVDWRSSWKNVQDIMLRSTFFLSGTSPIQEVHRYKEAVLDCMRLEKHIRRHRGAGWINVESDSWEAYDFLLPSTSGWNSRFEQITHSRAIDVAGSSEISDQRRRQAAATFWD